MMEVEVNEMNQNLKKSIERKNMVKENLNKFVNSLAKGDNVEIPKDAFNNVMADKVSSALDTTKQNIITSLYQQPETPNSVVGVDTPDNVEVANDDNAQ